MRLDPSDLPPVEAMMYEGAPDSFLSEDTFFRR